MHISSFCSHTQKKWIKTQFVYPGKHIKHQGQSCDVYVLWFFFLFSYEEVSFPKWLTIQPFSVKSEKLHQEFADKREQTKAGELLSPSLEFYYFIPGISTLS